MSGGYMGSTGQLGATGGYAGQSLNSTGSPYYANPQQALLGSTSSNLNDPATVLTHATDLNLSTKQVQRLEKMLSAGKQHATTVLTTVQKKKLVRLVGSLW